MKKVLKIEGMGCNHCVKSVKEALSQFSELKVIEVKIGEATIEVPENFDMEKIKVALDDVGYDVL